MSDKDYSYLKGKSGRKRIKFSEEDYANIEKWSGNGLSERQIAELLNTSVSTIARRKREKGNFDSALKKGRAKAVADVTNALYQEAINGSVQAQIFFLKNRDSSAWMDKNEVQHQVNLAQILDSAKNRVIEGHTNKPELTSQRVLSEDTLSNKENTG